MVEINGVGDLELPGRMDRDGPVAVLHPEPLSDDQKLLGLALFPNARTLEEEHERGRASVHDGHLGPVHLHPHVVDPQAEQCGHEVLHRRDPGAVRSNGCGQIRVHHIGVHGLDLGPSRLVSANETNARVRRGGFQCEPGLMAGMQSDPCATDLGSSASAVCNPIGSP